MNQQREEGMNRIVDLGAPVQPIFRIINWHHTICLVDEKGADSIEPNLVISTVILPPGSSGIGGREMMSHIGDSSSSPHKNLSISVVDL